MVCPPNLCISFKLIGVILHEIPGFSTHRPSWKRLCEHRTVVLLALVPNCLVPGDNPIGNRTPRIIIITIAAIFANVSQYSISPYLRTSKRLNMTTTTKKTAIQTAPYFASGTQKAIMFRIATRCMARPKARASQYE